MAAHLRVVAGPGGDPRIVRYSHAQLATPFVPPGREAITPSRPRLRAERGVDGNPRLVRYAVRHAPHSMQIGGQPFTGGEFIPDDAMAKATPQQKAMIGASGGGISSTVASAGTPRPASAAAASPGTGGLRDRDRGRTAARALKAFRRAFGDESATAEDLAALTGFGRGVPAFVLGVEELPDVTAIDLAVRSPDGKYKAQRRIALEGRDSGRASVISNESFVVKPESRGRGVGLAILSNQVAEAASRGFKELICHAERGEHFNGYYTWPRLGYDCSLSRSTRLTLPPSLASAARVSDLMKTRKGRALWLKNGQSEEMEFDLAEGSRSRRVLDKYRAGKGLPPIAAIIAASRSATSKTATTPSSTPPGTRSNARTRPGVGRPGLDRLDRPTTPTLKVVRNAAGSPRLVRYGFDPSQVRAPHNMIIGGKPYEGGQWVKEYGLAHATNQQLAMLGVTPEEAHNALAAAKVKPHPNSGAASHKPTPPGPPLARGNRKGQQPITLTEDMLPEDMQGLLHVENLEAIETQEGLDELVAMFRQSVENIPGGELPTQRHLEALLEAGSSVDGHYAEAMETMVNVFGLDGARMWAMTNGILSAQTKWEEHSVGAFRLIGAWIAGGRKTDEASVDDLLQDWADIRRPNGKYAYALWDDKKEKKIKSLLMDPGNVNLHDMGSDDWAKTPEFAGSFLDGSRVAVDTHMLKLVGMGRTADEVASLAKEVANDPIKYAAYKAAVGHLARKSGTTPAAAQERVWSATLGILLMKRHGMSPDDVNEYLTHGTVGQNWDIHAQLATPEVRSVLAKLPVPISGSAIEDLGRQGPGQGGLQKRGLRPDGAVSVRDPEALREVARNLGGGDSTEGKGIKPILPAGKAPPGWNPDERFIAGASKGTADKPKPWEVDPIGSPRTRKKLAAAGLLKDGKTGDRISSDVRQEARKAAYLAAQAKGRIAGTISAPEADPDRKRPAQAVKIAADSRPAKVNPKKKAAAKKKTKDARVYVGLDTLVRHAKSAPAPSREAMDRMPLKELFLLYCRRKEAERKASKISA